MFVAGGVFYNRRAAQLFYFGINCAALSATARR